MKNIDAFFLHGYKDPKIILRRMCELLFGKYNFKLPARKL